MPQAMEKDGVVWGNAYAMADGAICVPPESDIQRPEGLAGRAVAVGYHDGYRALGLPDGGWLAPGNKADVILVNLRRAHLIPLVRVVSNFVHQGQTRDIASVMVDGQWLMRDGVILTLDEDDIIDEANRIGRTAWKHVFANRPEFATALSSASRTCPSRTLCLASRT